MTSKETLDWDGEVIVRSLAVEPVKISPRELLDGIIDVRNKIAGMEDELIKIDDNKEKIKVNLEGAKKFLKQREEFEPKCIELQIEKLKFLITKISDECKTKAKDHTEKTIAKDPSSMTEEQKKNLAYITYQRALATHPDVAKKISSSIIKEHLFEKPIFDNPFIQ